MKPFELLFAVFVCGCSSNSLVRRPTPADTLPPATPIIEFAAVSPSAARAFLNLNFLPRGQVGSRVIQVGNGGGLFGGSVYTLADGVLIVDRFDWDAQRHHQEQRVLDLRLADVTWNEIRKLDIPRWRRSYTPQDIELGMQIFDGTQWSVTYIDGARGAVSGGDNAFPASSPLGEPALDSIINAYRRLLALLADLTKTPNKAPEPNRL